MTRDRMDAYLALEPKLPARRQAVYEAVRARGASGATLNEVGEALGWPLHRVSGRVTELAATGWLRATGQRRAGQTVWARGDGLDGRRTHGRRRMEATLEGFHAPHQAGTLRLTVELPDLIAARELRPGQRLTLEWRAGAAEEDGHGG